MPLPKVETATYEMKIPRRAKPMKYRPFLMREYKALLQSKEFGDDAAFANTVQDILNSCLLGEVEVQNLPIYLVDYIFLKIRAKSVGEKVEAHYSCNNIVEKPTPIQGGKPDEYELGEDGKPVLTEQVCATKFKVMLDLEKADIMFPGDYNSSTVVQLSETVGMKLKSPSFKEYNVVESQGDEMNPEDDSILSLTDSYIFACIESIYDGDKVLVPGQDFTFEEAVEFMNQFSPKHVEQITKFFQSQPVVGLDLKIKCPACGNESVISLRGIADFFA